MRFTRPGARATDTGSSVEPHASNINRRRRAVDTGPSFTGWCGSEPPPVPEDPIEDQPRHDHQPEGERIPVVPVELRHVPEVHAVDPRDEGRDEDDRSP